MKTVKFIDTCSLINLFDRTDVDMAPCFEEYDLVTTDRVIGEYTRKFHRKIPPCLSVVGIREEDLPILDELEFLLPRLGVGERSVLVSALNSISSGCRTVVISDDKEATKRLSDIASNTDDARLKGTVGIIWGNTRDLINRLEMGGKISEESAGMIRRKIHI